jgi:hypothetical protein
MNVGIGTEAAKFQIWEYLFRIFGILSLQCTYIIAKFRIHALREKTQTSILGTSCLLPHKQIRRCKPADNINTDRKQGNFKKEFGATWALDFSLCVFNSPVAGTVWKDLWISLYVFSTRQ